MSRRCSEPLLSMLTWFLPPNAFRRPEYTRHVWKLDPKNKGKLYTQGLWK